MLTGHVLPKLTNMSHIIHKVAFGPEYPGQVNPLDGFTRVNRPGDVPRAYKYFLKVGAVSWQCQQQERCEYSWAGTSARR